GIEGLLELFIQRQQFTVAPAGEVDEAGVDSFLLELQCSIESAVGLTDTCQHFPHREQVFFQLKLTVGTQALKVNQTAPNTLDTVGDELIRLLLEHRVREQFTVDIRQQFDQLGEVVTPGPV